MAAGVLPAVGTKYGPCKSACQHRDCASTREFSAAPCRICSEPIGYDTAYYRESDPNVRPLVLVHAICFELEIEAERKAGV